MLFLKAKMIKECNDIKNHYKFVLILAFFGHMTRKTSQFPCFKYSLTVT